jgi:Flp pilus assembly protein TadG
MRVRSLQSSKPSIGAVYVEFAIILPVLLFIMVGVLELGMLFIQDNTLNKSVRESSRYLSRNFGIDGCSTDLARNVIKANMDNLFEGTYANFNSDALGNSSEAWQICVTEDATGSITESQSIAASCDELADAVVCPAGSHLHILMTASYQAKMLVPGLMGFNFSPVLSARSVMRVQ